MGAGEAEKDMNCQEIDEKGLIESYLQGRLRGEELEAFQLHYFQCDRCFEELQLRQALAVELKELGTVTPLRPPSWYRSPWTWGLAAAAVLLVALVPLTLHEQGTLSGPEASAVLSQLAALQEVPPYPQPLLRSAEEQPKGAFERGMAAYVEGEFHAAFFLLQEAAAESPESPELSFYLGICYLKRGFPNGAAGALETAAQLEDGPYREISLWYLSKAYFQLGLMEKGIETLRLVSELGGAYQSQAREALDKAARLPAGR